MHEFFTISCSKKVTALRLSFGKMFVQQRQKETFSIYQAQSKNRMKLEKIQDDMSNALEYYNEFTPKCQYFKPHSTNAKKFLNNAEFINRQLNFYNESQE